MTDSPSTISSPVATQATVSPYREAKRRRIGLYGGSFNPIHLGHTQLGQWLCQEGYVDELWFLVSPLNPLKQGDDSLLSDELRLRLAHLAVGQTSQLRVSDFEMHLPRPSYMVHTLQALRQTYPELDFHLVIGADNWQRFPRWYQPAEIMAHHRILVYPREGYPIDTPTLPSGVQLVDAPLFPISSTAIRQAITQGTCQGQWLHPDVWTEIQRLGLYHFCTK